MIRDYFFSSNYFYFFPAILIESLWLLLPIPHLAKISLFIWSLPLFSAGAAYAMHQGQDTFIQLIHRRCPAQGIMLWLYPVVLSIAVFFLLLIVNQLGLTNSRAGELVTTSMFGVIALYVLYRFWPDYFLRIIHPWPREVDSWIGHDRLAIGPGPWTTWKLTGHKTGLPFSSTMLAIISILVITASVTLVFSEQVFNNSGVKFLFPMLLVTGILPIAHIYLIHLGYALLRTNQISLKSIQQEAPPANIAENQISENRKLVVWDDQAVVNNSVHDLLDHVIIITGWVFIRHDKREWNVVAAYRKEADFLIFFDGPHLGGHWGHEANYVEWEVDKALMGRYPDHVQIPPTCQKKIVRFLQNNTDH